VVKAGDLRIVIIFIVETCQVYVGGGLYKLEETGSRTVSRELPL